MYKEVLISYLCQLIWQKETGIRNYLLGRPRPIQGRRLLWYTTGRGWRMINDAMLRAKRDALSSWMLAVLCVPVTLLPALCWMSSACSCRLQQAKKLPRIPASSDRTQSDPAVARYTVPQQRPLSLCCWPREHEFSKADMLKSDFRQIATDQHVRGWLLKCQDSSIVLRSKQPSSSAGYTLTSPCWERSIRLRPTCCGY